MSTKTIRRVAVIGAGTMGPGIAQTYAQYGLDVAVYSEPPETMPRALANIQSNLDFFVRRGFRSEGERDQTLARLRLASSLEDAAGHADLVVEAVTEKKEIKQKLLRQLDAICPPGTIFASNTSYLNVFRGAPRPADTVIAHWFAPPHILPLVEVVRGPQTAEATVQTMVELLRGMGKTPVVLDRFVAGFAVNRLQRAMGKEIFYLLDHGYITPQDLDLAVKASIAPRMMVLGVVQRYDFTGLDLTVLNLENPDFAEAPGNPRPESLRRLVEAGHLGVKTGRGFYDYTGRPREEVLQERDAALLQVLPAGGRGPREPRAQ